MEIPVSGKHEGEGQVRGGGRIQMWASLQDKELLSSVYCKEQQKQNKTTTTKRGQRNLFQGTDEKVLDFNHDGVNWF